MKNKKDGVIKRFNVDMTWAQTRVGRLFICSRIVRSYLVCTLYNSDRYKKKNNTSFSSNSNLTLVFNLIAISQIYIRTNTL